MIVVVGSSVQWTKVSRGRGTISMRRMDGTVTAINGITATVKKKNGHCVEIPITRLRLSDQPTQLTEFVKAVASAAAKEGE